MDEGHDAREASELPQRQIFRSQCASCPESTSTESTKPTRRGVPASRVPRILDIARKPLDRIFTALKIKNEGAQDRAGCQA